MSLSSRACVATYGLATLFTALSARLHDLAVHDHEYYAALAREAYEDSDPIPARRGSILDVHDTVLARNEPLKRIIVDDTLLYEWDKKKRRPKHDDRAQAARAQTARIIAEVLGMTPEEVLACIKPGKCYSVVKKKGVDRFTEETASALATRLEVEKVKIRGITFDQVYDRVYPAGELLCHVIGLHAWDDRTGDFKGVEGVELSMNDWLTGQPGWRCYDKDGLGRELASYRGAERAPRHGANVRLTVDLEVQQIIESELEEACRQLKPKRATVIVMDPKTGAILAMASRPCFDPNAPGKNGENQLNLAVASIYEPGSTFKIVAAAGALNRGRYKLEDQIWCRNGRWPYPGGVLEDHHPYGMLSVEDVIAKSSNIGAVTLAKNIGEEAFYTLARSFGFGQRTNILLPGESKGELHPLTDWKPGSIYHVPMGHEISVTPLQMITATCAIANGGVLMMPQIIRDVRTDDGTILASYTPQEVRRVVQKETADQLNRALEKVTSKKGTAVRARVPGFRVAGKTGTTQIFDEKLRRYSDQDHTVSFVGYLPAENPKFCCIVVMEDSAVVNGKLDVGGLLAAPVFSKIAERVACQLGLKPDPQLLAEELERRKALEKEGQ